MQTVSSLMFTLAAIEILALPILLIVWLIRKAKKKPKMKWLKWFWLSFTLFLAVGAATNPATWCEHEYKLVESKEASCTENGYEKYHCNLCGGDKKETLKKLGHSMEDVRRVEPTDDKDGEYVQRCTRCGYEKTEVLPMPKKSTEQKTGSSESKKPEPTTEPVDTSVTFDEIYRAYKENELVANDTYRYNRYRITARINGMNTGGLLNLTGGATLTMEKKVGNTIVFFYAEFEKEQEEALKQVKVGDTITFEGECIGRSGFTDCELK